MFAQTLSLFFTLEMGLEGPPQFRNSVRREEDFRLVSFTASVILVAGSFLQCHGVELFMWGERIS